MNPNELIVHFKSLQNGDPCIFMVRHAEKHIAQEIAEDTLQSITPEGVAAAELLGHRLKKICPEVAMVKSSPVDRCMQTAHAIFSSYGIPITSSTLLGKPGIYISDGDLALQNFEEAKSPEHVFFKILAGEILPGMRSKAEGTKLLLTELLCDLDKLDHPGFYVTHDGFLAVFVGTLTGRPITHENWFQYLDSICIKRSDDRIELYWGQEMFDVTEKAYELLDVVPSRVPTC